MSSIPPEIRIAIFDAYGVVMKASNVVNEDVIELIQQLKEKGVKCYLATNEGIYRTQIMGELFDFKQLFNGVFTPDDLGCQKPDPRFFERMLHRIDPRKKISRQEMLFWDDSEANVLAAKELGLRAHQYLDEIDFSEKMLQEAGVYRNFGPTRDLHAA